MISTIAMPLAAAPKHADDAARPLPTPAESDGGNPTAAGDWRLAVGEALTGPTLRVDSDAVRAATRPSDVAARGSFGGGMGSWAAGGGRGRSGVGGWRVQTGGREEERREV